MLILLLYIVQKVPFQKYGVFHLSILPSPSNQLSMSSTFFLVQNYHQRQFLSLQYVVVRNVLIFSCIIHFSTVGYVYMLITK